MTHTGTGDDVQSARSGKAERVNAAALTSRVAALPPPKTMADELAASPSPAARLPCSRLRRGLWWCAYLLTWCVVMCLGAAAALRIFDHDGTYLLVWINAFTRYVYLPAYACLAWAAWQRRWGLALASLSIAVCHVVWMAPDFLPERRFDSRADPAAVTAQPSRTVRIFFANVRGLNTEHEALLQEIAEANPDVVVVAEFAWRWHIAFSASAVMAPYVYGPGELRSHIEGVNVFSKLPLKTELQTWIAGGAVQTVDIELGTQSLRLIGLHGPRPMGPSIYDYDGYWKQVAPLLSAAAGPVVIVGDFNATEHSLVYKQLTAERFRSAHEDRGRGYATTWPNGLYWLPPIRIDQALLSPEVECQRIVEGRGLGSDHKPLILDVQMRGNRERLSAPAVGAGG